MARAKVEKSRRKLRWANWASYLLGPFTGVPKLVSGIRHHDVLSAYHGAQATVFGTCMLLGTALVSVLMGVCMPYFGFGSFVGTLLSLAFFVVTYAFLGVGLYLWFMCLYTAKHGGTHVWPWLSEQSERFEIWFARRMGVEMTKE